MKILLIEDDKNINDHITLYLKKDNFEVASFYSAEEAIKYLDSKPEISLVITDLNLPGISGEMFTEYLKKKSNTPVIMLTAKSGTEQIIEGLNIGADDYITKPFSTQELLARVRVILRRYDKKVDNLLFKDDKIEIKSNNGDVLVNGKEVTLTQVEYKILKMLVDNRNQILTRETLVEKTINDPDEVYDRVIDSHIKSIRKKLKDDSKNPEYIKTVYGVGYKFKGGY